MALHSLYCADVPWRNCSLTLTHCPAVSPNRLSVFWGLWKCRAEQL